jgi:hypothetical protein
MHERELARLLHERGSSLTASQVRDNLTQSKREIAEDNSAHGLPAHSPFWDLISDEQVHVLSIFDSDTVDLFVFAAEFNTLIRRLNALAMSETDRMRTLLQEEYDLVLPQISIPRPQAEYWLGEAK